MTSQHLYKFFTAQPFKPFNICLADGRKVGITSREMMSYVEKGRTAAVWIPREQAYETVDLLLVTSLEPASHRNDKRRKSEAR